MMGLVLAAGVWAGGVGAADTEPRAARAGVEAEGRARAALALALAGMSVEEKEPDPPRAAGTIDTAPLKVQCGLGHGSGTAIKGGPAGKTWFVTNRHVAKIGISAVQTVGGTVYPAKVVDTSPQYDLAIGVADGVIPAVDLDPKDPPVGTRVRVRGNGRFSGGFDKVRTGTIASYSGGDLTANLLGSPGDSGSGYFGDDGRLVGVLWGGPSKDLSPFSIGVRASAVYEFVQTVKGTPQADAATYVGGGASGFLWHGPCR